MVADIIKSLVGLDEIDRALDREQSKKGDLLAELEARRKEVDEAQKRAHAADIELRDNLKSQKLLELDLAANQKQIDKISDVNTKARNDAEYKENQHRVDELKKAATEAEDRLLAFMEHKDRLEAAKKARHAEAAAAKARFEATQKELDGRLALVARNLDEMAARRAVRCSEIPEDWLDRYNGVRGMRGDALATVEDGACQGCNVDLTLNIAALVMGGQLQVCPSCSRILVPENV